MRTWLRRTCLVTGVTLLAIAGGAGVYIAQVASQAPPVNALKITVVATPSIILSADGQELGRMQGTRQEPVKLADVSPYVVQALIDTEDHRFRSHHGIDWLRSLRALVRTGTGHIEGGSTITQQLARNLFPEDIGRSRNISRKIKEIVTAIRIERLYSKDQILEAYLNTVPFLYNTVGIESAARTYFNKSARDLDPTESATLVGMLKGTYYFNPVRHPERANARRNLVLAQMRRHGHLADLDEPGYQALRQSPLNLRFTLPDNTPDEAPHFTAYVRRWLEDWADDNDHDLDREGLVIHTTLDTRMQEAATQAVAKQTAALQAVADVEWSRPQPGPESHAIETYRAAAKRLPAFAHFWRTHPELLDEALRKTPRYQALRQGGQDDAAALRDLRRDAELIAAQQRAKTRLEAGFLALDPGTGAVKAWVGSRDYTVDQFDHVAQAARQPGSTFKPIVYAAALEHGIPAYRTYLDAPFDVPLGDGRVWRPTDMSGSTYQPMTMWEGLVYSKNAITTQVLLDTGLDRVSTLAKAMGITRSPLDVVPSMALGTSPVTLLELANVYATIADEGRYREPFVVSHIEDRQGHVIASFGPRAATQVLSPEADGQLIDMMRGVVRQGTGHLLRARYVHDVDVAGKTGTSQNNADGWFMLIHPQLVVGAWVGFNDQRVTMRGSYWGQGGHSALLLVGDFMRQAVGQRWVDAKVAFSAPTAPITLASRDMAPGAGNITVTAADPEDSRHDDPITTDPANMGTMGFHNDEPPRSAEELGEVMKAMGRDPETGAPLPRAGLAEDRGTPLSSAPAPLSPTSAAPLPAAPAPATP